MTLSTAEKSAQGANDYLDEPATLSMRQSLADRVNYMSSGVNLTESTYKGITKREYYKESFGLSLLKYAESNAGNLKIPNTRQPQLPEMEVPTNSGSARQTVTTNEGTAANGNTQAIVANSGNTEVVPSNTATQQLQVGTYKNMTAANAGTGNSADHIPSYASLVAAEEARLGRPLSSSEKKIIKENGLTLVVNTQVHQTTSQTYGGRNSRARQLQDAANPVQAVYSNVNAYRATMRAQGYTNEQIDQAIQRLVAPFQMSSYQSSGNGNNSSTSNSTSH
jgi:hypothetical protein